MQIIAHRGASFDCPDNTLDSFSQAIERGASCVETDLRVCADGALVLCHDPVIKAHEGPGICIAEHHLAYIRANALVGAALLELDDLLSFLERAGCRIHLEIKPGPLQMDVVGDVSTKLLQSGVQGLISSFDPAIVALAGKSGATTLLLMDDLPLDTLRRTRACGASAVGIDIRAIKGPHVAKIAATIPTYSFTVNTMAQLRRCTQAGLTGVYSDHPDLLSVLREQCMRHDGEIEETSTQDQRDLRLLNAIESRTSSQ